jgi:polysaccharide export outer membrane protein
MTAILLGTGSVLSRSAAAADSVTSLVEVRSDTRTGDFLLVCDGVFSFSRMNDSGSGRMVVDLPNVRNAIKKSKIPFKSDLVTGISVADSEGGEPGTRVVFDLKRPCPANLRVDGKILVVSFEPGPATEVPAPADPAPGEPLGSPLAAGIVGQASPARVGTAVELGKSEYIIGSEDLLELSVFEQPDLTRTVRVSGDGTISLPLLGIIPVAGLTTKQAESKLQDLLGDKYLTNPQVSVFVKEAKSKKVSVVGAVEKPGTVEMLGQRTLLETISEAGGLTQQAGKELYVLRPDRSGATTRIDVDLDDLMINGNPELNIPILPGDVINIPIDRLLHVYVDGAVRKPGEVEYKASRPLTLLQAIAAAGGLSERASQKGIILIRNHTGDSSQQILKIDLKAVRKGKEPNIVLEIGDSIYVPETFF